MADGTKRRRFAVGMMQVTMSRVWGKGVRGVVICESREACYWRYSNQLAARADLASWTLTVTPRVLGIQLVQFRVGRRRLLSTVASIAPVARRRAREAASREPAL
jgi:hypothetical protein